MNAHEVSTAVAEALGKDATDPGTLRLAADLDSPDAKFAAIDEACKQPAPLGLFQIPPADGTAKRLIALLGSVPIDGATCSRKKSMRGSRPLISLRESVIGLPVSARAYRIKKMPSRNPKSPTRFVMKAFLPASAFAFSWYQKPMSR